MVPMPMQVEHAIDFERERKGAKGGSLLHSLHGMPKCVHWADWKIPEAPAEGALA